MEFNGSYYEKNLLKAIFATKGIKFFWKDKERRFIGANQAFLDFYGFQSEQEIIGRTDEDMGWHVDPVPFKNDEVRVIENGETIENAEGTCIIRGEIRNIRANKNPIYDDEGNIVGLVGYFIDITDEVRKKEHTDSMSRKDPLTGLLNQEGLMEQLGSFVYGYLHRGLNFVCIYLNIDDFKKINSEYGTEYSDDLLTNVAECFSLTLATGGIMARMYGDNFVILHQLSRDDQVDILISRLRLALNKVSFMSQHQMTPGVSVGTALMSEVKNGEELVNLAEARMMEDKEHRKKNGIITGIS
ncbi:MAG: GGDEF domain-containing protein [Lachnospiraceae bacterium]|nr:GGDEF domain-containing protein [Lachnospiraceae bacterium]